MYKRNVFLLLLLALFWAYPSHSQSHPISKKVHRIVFIGNSITYSGQYVTDLEAYFLAHYPKRHLEFINLGLPSETVSGLSEEGHADGQFPRPDLHERLDRILAQTKPDLVFACYGMNDGIYLPFDEQRFQKFKDGINWLHDKVVQSGAEIIHLTPPVYDEKNGKSIGYAQVLDQYSTWLLHQQETAQWEVADIHFPMKAYLEEHRDKKADFAFAQDGVHPNDLGHWVMAQQILLYLGETSAARADDILSTLTLTPKAREFFTLVDTRQKMMKDAWLTAIGHKRPSMNAGMPLAEAKTKEAEMEKEIRTYIGTK
ncbi:MAG: SGNH/GDSL hydrolase family protein [Siphonobacter sp.]